MDRVGKLERCSSPAWVPRELLTRDTVVLATCSVHTLVLHVGKCEKQEGEGMGDKDSGGSLQGLPCPQMSPDLKESSLYGGSASLGHSSALCHQ